jgi:hypothetical protein
LIFEGITTFEVHNELFSCKYSIIIQSLNSKQLLSVYITSSVFAASDKKEFKILIASVSESADTIDQVKLNIQISNKQRIANNFFIFHV